MDFIEVVEVIHLLRDNGICLEDIEKELDYRENANNSHWNDNLCEYSTEELADIEYSWDDV